MSVNQGDIFITKLERNFYGAFKVLKKGKSFFDEIDGDLLMIAVLNYIDKEEPKISDERLNEVLCCDRFFFSNQYCINFFTDNPKHNRLNEYEYLGNKPITDFEREIEFKLGDGIGGVKGGFPLSGVVEPYIVNNVFLEWRWNNEREEFQIEVEIQNEKSRIAREEYQKRLMKPKKMLQESLFWEVINKIDWTEEDDEDKMNLAIEFLSRKKVSEIKQFQESLSYKLYQLDTKEHAKNIGEGSYKDKETHFSIDYFLYVRCCAISNGQIFFVNALNNPKQMPKDLDFEAILYLAEQAYEKRMNKELKYDTGCDYETFSNIKGWK